MKLNDELKAEAMKSILGDQAFPASVEDVLLEHRRIHPQLSEAQKQAALECIDQGKPLPPEVEEQFIRVSPATELEQLKTLGEYTKFHLGLYMTLLAAIVTFLTSELGPPLGSDQAWPFLITVVLLAFAGACGGMIGSNIPNHASLTRFEKTSLKKGFVKAKAATWITLEHGFFWLGMAVMLGGLLWFKVTRSETSNQTEVSNVLTAYSEAWNRSDFARVASLWVETGEYRNIAGDVIHGREQIQERLTANPRGAQGPFSVAERNVYYTDSSHAIVDGSAQFNIGEKNALRVANDRFTALVVKTKGSWAIHMWRWTSADPSGNW